MAVKLRLARVALTRNSPHYTIVAIPSTLRMTARPLEILGTYQPIPIVLPPPSLSPNGSIRGSEWGPRQSKREAATQEVGEKRVEWNESRVRWWLERGAEPSKRVERLLISAGILKTNMLAPVNAANAPVMSRKRRLREAVQNMSSNLTPSPSSPPSQSSKKTTS